MEELCRVCHGISENMVNIFEGSGSLGISIEHMISEVTGFRLEKGDSFSETICPPCLEDAQNAYDIIKTYERSYRIFCEAKDAILEDDIPEEEASLASDRDGESLLIAEEPPEDNDRVEKAPLIKGNDQSDQQTKRNEIKDAHSNNNINNVVPSKIKGPVTRGFNKRDKKVNDTSGDDSDQSDDQIKHNGTGKKDYVNDSARSEKGYKCSYCQKIFAHPSMLKRHMLMHTGERPFKCSHCTKSFRQNGNLTLHFRTHTGEKPFKCTTCKSAFPSQSRLTEHKRIHTGEKPFRCTVCRKAFPNVSKLNQHRKVHSKERPFQCEYCEKSFVDIEHLRRHTRTHTGERPYKCPHCQTHFRNSANLIRHRKLHEKEQP
ncbi:zinc finger protein 184-like [Drosophila subpulchrella]|uniref:zinc finger protein 184-like n=1 Tax=Drosophila subpulchrella TaxID=1486046 RepID=UPI0018A14258|nr:zinc finger protein 184-like [Drosophila subpulchrella]